MLEVIEFKNEQFMTKDDYNVCNFTENTVIICNNYKLMDTLAKEILDTINGNAEYNDYWCNEEDVGKGYMALAFGLQRVIKIGDQTITIGLEPSLVYKVNNPEDVWLFSCVSEDTPSKYKGYIYPFLAFKGSRRLWEDGKEAVYRNLCNGRYGCYDEKWIKSLCEETHNCNKK